MPRSNRFAYGAVLTMSALSILYNIGTAALNIKNGNVVAHCNYVTHYVYSGSTIFGEEYKCSTKPNTTTLPD